MKLIDIITSELKLDKDKAELEIESVLLDKELGLAEKIVKVKESLSKYRDSVYDFQFWIDFVDKKVVKEEENGKQ
jgi:hypothetical protein